MKTNFFCALALLVTTLSMYPTFIENCYASVLGNEDASAEYQTQFRQALAAFNVPDVDSVIIKKMNTLAPSCVGSTLYTFTMCGIWINEPLLNACDPQERTFAIYHEAAHYAQKHHQTVLLYCAPTPLILAGIIKLSSSLDTSTVKKTAAGLVLTAASAFAFDKLVLRPLVISQEQQADIAAARMLRQLGKQSVVDAYVHELEECSIHGHGHDTDGWHCTIAEQAEYLKETQN